MAAPVIQTVRLTPEMRAQAKGFSEDDEEYEEGPFTDITEFLEGDGYNNHDADTHFAEGYADNRGDDVHIIRAMKTLAQEGRKGNLLGFMFVQAHPPTYNKADNASEPLSVLNYGGRGFVGDGNADEKRAADAIMTEVERLAKEGGFEYIGMSPVFYMRCIVKDEDNPDWDDVDHLEGPLLTFLDEHDYIDHVDHWKKKYVDEAVSDGPTWQGYSESDLTVFNSMFDVDQPGETLTPEAREAALQEKIRNFSMCPVCLRVAVRSEACMFMTHVCEAPYHSGLYEKYKYSNRGDRNKYIEWCTICGRICKGHRHYKLAKADAPRPRFTTAQAVVGVEAFGPDCSNQGGGGAPEKFVRIQRMIDKVCELQAKVGKMSEQKARNKLIEAIWNAPTLPVPTFAEEVKKRGFFHIEDKCKGTLNKPVADKEVVRSDVERPTDQKMLTPVKYEGYSDATVALRKQADATPAESSQKETREAAAKAAENAEKPGNYCGLELGIHDDNRPTYGFRHKQPNGTILDHGAVKEERFCGVDLEEALRQSNIGTTKGKCPIAAHCQAKMYPEEIKGIVSDEYYETYKRLFNEVNGGAPVAEGPAAAGTGAKGGAASTPIFGELTEQCALPSQEEEGGVRKTRRKTVKAPKPRKTRRARKEGRRTRRVRRF
jgi:hypothetical protein